MIELNKVYTEDCLLTMARMPDNFVDLVVTSPPYDKTREYKGYSFEFEKVAFELFRVLKDGGVLVWVVNDQTISGSETGTSFRQALYFKDVVGFKLYDTMIYAKDNPLPKNHKRYEQAFEYMFIFSKGKPSAFNALTDDCKTAGKISSGTARNSGKDYLSKFNGYGRPTKQRKIRKNIWNYTVGYNSSAKNKIAYKHPAIFPEQLVNDHILSWSNEKSLVYDCFAGSGTTGIVAKRLNRNFVLSEISSEYCDIIKERFRLEFGEMEL